jgi:FixJ family two-component response regulator
MSEKDQKIYIIDDDVTLCNGIRWLLESINFKVETYHSAINFLKVYKVDWCGCLLIDIRMPEMSGLQLQDRLIALGNPLPIIMISGHGDISMAIRALKAGAIDFILKPFNDQQLLEQIQKAMSLSREIEIKQSVLNRYNKLSAREKDILTKVLNGKMNKQISHELEISIKTVEFHRANIMQKMEANSILELAKLDFPNQGLG